MPPGTSRYREDIRRSPTTLGWEAGCQTTASSDVDGHHEKVDCRLGTNFPLKNENPARTGEGRGSLDGVRWVMQLPDAATYQYVHLLAYGDLTKGCRAACPGKSYLNYWQKSQ